MAQFKHISLHFVTAMRFFHNYCLQRASDAAKFHTPPTETGNCQRHSAPISRGQTPLHWGNKPVGSGNNLHVTPRKVLCLGEQSIFKSSAYIFRSFVFTLLTETRNFARRVMEVFSARHGSFPPTSRRTRPDTQPQRLRTMPPAPEATWRERHKKTAAARSGNGGSNQSAPRVTTATPCR